MFHYFSQLSHGLKNESKSEDSSDFLFAGSNFNSFYQMIESMFGKSNLEKIDLSSYPGFVSTKVITEILSTLIGNLLSQDITSKEIDLFTLNLYKDQIIANVDILVSQILKDINTDEFIYEVPGIKDYCETFLYDFSTKRAFAIDFIKDLYDIPDECVLILTLTKKLIYNEELRNFKAIDEFLSPLYNCCPNKRVYIFQNPLVCDFCYHKCKSLRNPHQIHRTIY